MQRSQQSYLFVLKIQSSKKLMMIIAGLLLCSVSLSYIFQEIVFRNHCFTKLGIILSGNLLFWTTVFPVLANFSNRKAGTRYYTAASLGIGVGLLFCNQLFIQKAIFWVFLYGFGCLEGVSHPGYMLFENNIITSGIIYCILVMVTYHQATGRRQRIDSEGRSGNLPEAIATPAYRSYINIKNNGITGRVDVRDIRYIEASGNTILIFTTTRKHVLYQSMVSISKELDPAAFIKIHRAYLVNRAYIRSYAGIGNGNTLITLSCGAELVMSRHYKTRVLF